VEMSAIRKLLQSHQLIGIDNPGDIQRLSKTSAAPQKHAGRRDIGKIRFKAVKIAEQFLVTLKGEFLSHQIDSFSSSCFERRATLARRCLPMRSVGRYPFSTQPRTIDCSIWIQSAKARQAINGGVGIATGSIGACYTMISH